MYYIPEVRKNFVSESLLNKYGLKLVFEANNFILSKGGMFVKKDYMYEGMFKLNINNKNNIVVAYFAEPSISYLLNSGIWHMERHKQLHVYCPL